MIAESYPIRFNCQLLGAPRVFENDVPTSANIFDDPLFNYYRDVLDEQWIRAIDFTSDSRIGQSSAICLELPNGRQFPNFSENFAYYEESERQYTLQTGVPFSQNWGLVPIVAPPQGGQIPYDILFKVNSLVQHACLAEPSLDGDFYRLVDPCRMPLEFIEHASEKIYHSKQFCDEPTKWLTDQYKTYLKSKNHPRSPAISLDTRLLYVLWVQITPCKFILLGMLLNMLLGQDNLFGSSTETLSAYRDEVEIIPDVKKLTHNGNEYVFSDGIGKISLEFAWIVAKKYGYDSTPSAFQIKYGGYKGVVAVDPTSCYKLSLRKSMQKYDSINTKLDAQEVLDLMSSGEITNVLKEMLICGYKPNEEPFLSMMLQTFRASKLLEL
ncbi:hypothetical protein JHK86_018958 [Glycine max]|nr:hypothetical protein JHK86_018958 [Glycine max]